VRGMAAASSAALRPVLAGPARPAEWLGATPAGLYLRTEQLWSGGQPSVLAVLTVDARRLPCGLLLPSTSAELPLISLGPPRGTCLVGDGTVTWAGPAGPVAVRAVREWAPVRPARGAVMAAALATVGAGLSGVDPETDSELLASVAAAAGDHEASAAAARLLGRGPGLTPSGDDQLAGLLVGAWAFGLDLPGIRDIVALAGTRTTALSATLLWHAARGECIDEVAAVAAALCGQRPAGPALRDLLAVGHTSGFALALGLVTAAARALSLQPRPGPRGRGTAGAAA
jgi:hypothetical protein